MLRIFPTGSPVKTGAVQFGQEEPGFYMTSSAAADHARSIEGLLLALHEQRVTVGTPLLALGNALHTTGQQILDALEAAGVKPIVRVRTPALAIPEAGVDKPEPVESIDLDKLSSRLKLIAIELPDEVKERWTHAQRTEIMSWAAAEIAWWSTGRNNERLPPVVPRVMLDALDDDSEWSAINDRRKNAVANGMDVTVVDPELVPAWAKKATAAVTPQILTPIYQAASEAGVRILATGMIDPVMEKLARDQANYCAAHNQGGHQLFPMQFQRYGQAYKQLRSVVAQSWEGKSGDELAGARDCFDSWRQSSGHWEILQSECMAYGFAMALSESGIWYAAGYVADSIPTQHEIELAESWSCRQLVDAVADSELMDQYTAHKASGGSDETFAFPGAYLTADEPAIEEIPAQSSDGDYAAAVADMKSAAEAEIIDTKPGGE